MSEDAHDLAGEQKPPPDLLLVTLAEQLGLSVAEYQRIDAELNQPIDRWSLDPGRR